MNGESEQQPTMTHPASQLPSVDRLLGSTDGQVLVAQFGRQRVSQALRELLANARQQITRGKPLTQDIDWIGEASAVLSTIRLDYQRVFNLTGTVLHTNLGRALLAESAIEAAVQAAAYPTTLEYDLDSGRRGARADVIEQLICELTGAEAATVTNNNAAAVVLALNTIALGHEAIVSRGELVEIGGSFRIPDIMTRSGVKLREVGTTNRTHLRDYDAAIDEHVALVMKVHTSNYEIKGFTHEVPTQDLVGLAREKNVPLYFDLGSGNLIPLEPLGLPFEATVKQVLSEGIDLVSFSGDKLLGGPQAGFLAGKRALIDQIKRNPLHRAFRLDKMTLAALQATLQLYLTPERLTQTLPTLRDLTRSERDIRAVSNEMLPEFKVRLAPDFACVSEGLLSQIGSGALPTKQIPSWGVSITASEGKGEAQLALLAGALRALPIPIIGRITQGRLLLDFRMLQQEHLDDFRASLSSLKMP